MLQDKGRDNADVEGTAVIEGRFIDGFEGGLGTTVKAIGKFDAGAPTGAGIDHGTFGEVNHSCCGKR